MKSKSMKGSTWTKVGSLAFSLSSGRVLEVNPTASKASFSNQAFDCPDIHRSLGGTVSVGSHFSVLHELRQLFCGAFDYLLGNEVLGNPRNFLSSSVILRDKFEAKFMSDKKQTLDQNQKERPLEILRKTKTGESLSIFDGFLSWFPSKPKIEKNPNAVRVLYGAPETSKTAGLASSTVESHSPLVSCPIDLLSDLRSKQRDKILRNSHSGLRLEWDQALGSISGQAPMF